jgi:hypothetical protein
VTLLLALSATALGSAPVGVADFRISNVGADGDAAREGIDPAVAYNSTDDEYLVTWEADGLATDDEFEVFGQRVSSTGAEIGTDFRISTMGTDTDTGPAGITTDVAYNSTDNEYLVTWEGDGLASPDYEVFGARVSAAGAPGSKFRISTMGTDDTGAGFNAAVAYNSTDNEYLVIWQGDGLATDDEFEVFGQRLSAAGADLGATNDFRISNVGTDGDTDPGIGHPALAYGSTANDYLVTWTADGLATDDEFEIFGQRVSAAGAEEGSDFRISTVGSDGDAARDAEHPSVAYNSADDEYLVTWGADGLATDDEVEIFGQRVDGAGAEVGSDFRISNVGTDGDANRDADDGAVAYNPDTNAYLVTWHGDGLATNEELEIFGQDVSAGGGQTGSDFRISTVGTDCDFTRGARRPALAYNGTSQEYLVAWQGDGLATDDESEIFGRRVGAGTPTAPSACTPATPSPDTDPPDTDITKQPKNKIKKKKKAVYKFTSLDEDTRGTTYECKLNASPWIPCVSPIKINKTISLQIKACQKEIFKVRATDAAGNTDLSPAKDSFKLKPKTVHCGT